MSETKKYANLLTELSDQILPADDPESSGGSDQKGTTRRDFFRDVTVGAAGIAVASALAQLGAPAQAQAQEQKKELRGFAPPNVPPWPTGTAGNKYDHLFCTRIKENSITEAVAGPQAYFRGASDLPGAGINMGWQMFVKPIRLEMQSHHHDVDEYLFFLGAQLPDLTANFDAEIEYFLGEEYERHVITKPTVLYIPRGLEHNPCDIKRVSKPMLFSALQLAPYFNGYYQTGYMQLTKMAKIG
jgi:hypothetical protein